VKRIYIAGPMSGLPESNYPLFHRTAKQLRAAGFHVENPAETVLPITSTWNAFMRESIPRLVSCDLVVMLPGWRDSKGAYLEVTLAQALDISVVPVDELLGAV